MLLIDNYFLDIIVFRPWPPIGLDRKSDHSPKNSWARPPNSKNLKITKIKIPNGRQM